MALTYQQSKLVKTTVPALREHGERITTIFYRNLLRYHPELDKYFNNVNQLNGRQPRALTAVILDFANNINHISGLIPKLERMCHKHCSLGIKPEHYELVANYLIEAFGEVLGPVMTPECRVELLKAYWMLAKMLIGREVRIYKEFTAEKWLGWRKFKIARKVVESDDIVSFYLTPKDGKRLPSYLPGQYISLRVYVPGLGYLQSRQYSLTSEAYFSPGIVSNLLIDRLNPGDQIDMTHPSGEFFLDTSQPRNVPIVLISAGIGWAPMVAKANTVLEAQPSRQISWIHGSRRLIPFEDHIAHLKRRHPANFRTNIFKTNLANGDLAGVTYSYKSRMDLAKVHLEDLWLNHGGTDCW